jgi:hypothetical protein
MPEKDLAGYVSVNLRLALMKADHPDAVVDFEVVAAEDSGIHPVFRGDTKWFVVCTIAAPGMVPITAWKEVPQTVVRWEKGVRKEVPATFNPEFLVKLQTMAAGRALKQMGYPDAISDLKPLLLWRRRQREIDLLAGMQSPVAELTKGDGDGGGAGDDALEAIAGAARPAQDDEITDAEVIDDELPEDERLGAEGRQSRLLADSADAEWVGQAGR